MKRLHLLLAGALVLGLAVPGMAQFVQSGYDLGAPDTLGVEFGVLPDAGSGSYLVKADLWVFADSNNLDGITTGLSWGDSDMEIDSAVASTLTLSSLDYSQFFFYRNSVDSTSLYRWFLFAAMRKDGSGLQASSSRQVIASYYFTVTNWTASDSVVIDSAYFNSGSKLAFVCSGSFDEYRPYRETRWVGYDTPAPCCQLRVGDANCSGDDEPTIGDLNRIVDFLFLGGAPLCCIAEADANKSGGDNPTVSDITIGDANYLQDYLFITGPSLGLQDCY